MPNKKLLVDCTNLSVGGGMQVAISFINDLLKMEHFFNVVIVLSPQLKKSFCRNLFPSYIRFVDIPSENNSIRRRNKVLRIVEDEFGPDVVFCLFGPSYYKSKCKKIVGYAIPHYIYEDSPYFDLISAKEKILHYFRQFLKVRQFKKNSDILIFETNDSRLRFCKKFKFDVKMTYVVSNTINSIFQTPENWVDTKLDGNKKKIFCLSANYKHKNLQLLPLIIETLVSKYNFEDFEFVLSLEKTDLNIHRKYDSFIRYIGKIDLVQLPLTYKAMDIVFIPSLLEVFSATYVEAMKMCIPIVASDMSFARDICGDAAVYFKPTDANSAAEQLVRVFNDSDLRLSLVNRGTLNLERFGSSMNRTENYVKIINNVLTKVQ